MKILKIVYDWPPPWQGLAPHPYELTKAQAQLGHKFVLFCGNWPKSGPREPIENMEIKAFVREPFPGTLTFTSSILMFFYYLLWRADPKNDVDLIHTHGHFAVWIYFYRNLLKKIWPRAFELQTPLVVHFHNVAQGREDAAKEKNIEIKTESKLFSWPMEKYANKLAVQTADALIFVSEENKNYAIELYGVDPAKCHVVETGVNTELFRPVGQEEKEKTRRDLGIDAFDKVILNHGMMVERKNIHLLVEAMRYVPDNYKLLLVGPGDMAYVDKIDEIIQEHKLQGKVLKTGYTPYPLAAIAFQAADLFVLPSSWEGFPKVVMQSLACGVPALVSGFRAQNEIPGLHYLSGVEPENIAAEARAIIENPTHVARVLIEKDFSWRVKALQLDDIYRKLF